MIARRYRYSAYSTSFLPTERTAPMLDTPGSPPRCDCCGGALATRYQAQVPLTGEIFRIARCGQCGLGHTLPQPEELSRYYGAQYTVAGTA